MFGQHVLCLRCQPGQASERFFKKAPFLFLLKVLSEVVAQFAERLGDPLAAVLPARSGRAS